MHLVVVWTFGSKLFDSISQPPYYLIRFNMIPLKLDPSTWHSLDNIQNDSNNLVTATTTTTTTTTTMTMTTFRRWQTSARLSENLVRSRKFVVVDVAHPIFGRCGVIAFIKLAAAAVPTTATRKTNKTAKMIATTSLPMRTSFVTCQHHPWATRTRPFRLMISEGAKQPCCLKNPSSNCFPEGRKEGS